MKPFNSLVVPEEEARDMPAIRIANAPLSIVIFGKKEGGVSAVSRILVEELLTDRKKRCG